MCVCVCMYVCSSLVRFSLFVSPLKSWSQITTKLGSKDAIGFLHMLMNSNVMYQGQGSSEVKLGGKCKIGIILFEKLKSYYNQTWFVDVTCEALTRWVGGALSNLVFFWVILMQVTMIMEFPASHCHLARGIMQVYLLYFSNMLSVVEPLAVLGMAYLSYLLAELFHFSGIIRFVFYDHVCVRWIYVYQMNICSLILMLFLSFLDNFL